MNRAYAFCEPMATITTRAMDERTIFWASVGASRVYVTYPNNWNSNRTGGQSRWNFERGLIFEGSEAIHRLRRVIESNGRVGVRGQPNVDDLCILMDLLCVD